MRLKDRVAIITGGASGIGLAMSTRFAAEGAKVVIADINPETGETAKMELLEKGYTAEFCKVDLSSEESIAALMKSVAELFGGIDILCNNAGVCIAQNIADLTDKVMDLQINVNIKGMMYCCKHAIPYMKEKGKGAIVNTASVVGLTASPNQAPYTATKGAVLALTRQIAYDYAKYNIRVNAICPADTKTKMFDDWLAAQENPEETLKFFLSRFPMGRIALPEEQASVALFLASDDASFVTGQAIPVDGGYSIW